jgi:hypothetical protein
MCEVWIWMHVKFKQNFKTVYKTLTLLGQPSLKAKQSAQHRYPPSPSTFLFSSLYDGWGTSVIPPPFCSFGRAGTVLERTRRTWARGMGWPRHLVGPHAERPGTLALEGPTRGPFSPFTLATRLSVAWCAQWSRVPPRPPWRSNRGHPGEFVPPLAPSRFKSERGLKP